MRQIVGQHRVDQLRLQGNDQIVEHRVAQFVDRTDLRHIIGQRRIGRIGHRELVIGVCSPCL